MSSRTLLVMTSYLLPLHFMFTGLGFDFVETKVNTETRPTDRMMENLGGLGVYSCLLGK